MEKSAENMHEITGSNPAVMHNFWNSFENRIYANVRVHTFMQKHILGKYKDMHYILTYSDMNILYSRIAIYIQEYSVNIEVYFSI